MWSVYILECSDGTLYTGISNNVAARLDSHNAGDGAKYTRGRLPVALVYEEEIGERSDALRREIEIKRLSAAVKRQLIRAKETETR